MFWKHGANLAVCLFLALPWMEPSLQSPGQAQPDLLSDLPGDPSVSSQTSIMYEAHNPALMVCMENGGKMRAIRENWMYTNKPAY